MAEMARLFGFRASLALASLGVLGCTENPRELFGVSKPPSLGVGSDTESDGPDLEETDARDTDSKDASADDGKMDPANDAAAGPGAELDAASGTDTEAPGGGETDPQDATDVSTDEDEPSDPDGWPLPDADELDARCGGAPSASSSGAFTRRALRQAAGQCAVWHYCRFGAVAEVLDARVQEHADVGTERSLAGAQEAWKAAMQSWSRVELFQFGPLGSRADSAGKDMYEGRGIRDLIYAWPSISHCRVDEQVISRNYATRGMDSALISGRGLFGLEVLLFYPGFDTACGGNTAAAWAELSHDEIASRRRDYAAAISSDIVTQTETLLELWSPAGGDFMTTFVDAQGAYPSEQEVLKVLAWSLVYAEREVKDWKVGIPAGYTLSHPVTSPESPYARVGIDNIRGNLSGFLALFGGCGEQGEGLGFDDWLVDAGHAELAGDMTRALHEALRVADTSPPLHEASPEEIETLYRALRDLTSLLKSEFFGAGSPLNLQLPGGVEGDTD